MPGALNSKGKGRAAPVSEDPAGNAAFVLRSAALFIILFQFRLLAADLADTPVFTAALLCAFVSAFFIAKKKIPPVPAFCILVLIPWAARAIIAFPRLFINGTAAVLDSLLLNFDRNTFVSLLPAYWAGLTSYFARRSRLFLRGDIIASDLLLGSLFCVIRAADLEAYRWPVLMISLFTVVLLLQLAALMLSLPPRLMLRRGEGIRAGLALGVLVILGGLLLLRPSQEGAVDRGGGLLQPKLFQFDFSQILRLESEISMNDDLVLIVRKDAEDTHFLLRRFVLSGYSQKQGFYRHEEFDEAAHPARLPDRTITLKAPPTQVYRVTNQEYFLVNFDASAFIGMNEPVKIVPFESWDASSFNSAYAVQSHTSEARAIQLLRSVTEPPGPAALGLSDAEYAFYTEYGGDKRIAAFAGEIAGDLETYWEKVQGVYERLKYGEYRYSLKPGIAPDGDQLGFFLFTAKKGYCSYYAFSMTLLLRSLGIPARVAVGFFADPATGAFNYYPVQSYMAHAWVEVWYPGYGWIEYDPTSVTLAADENYIFGPGVSQDLFERLMKEILENRSRLSPKEGAGNDVPGLAALGIRTGRFLRENFLLIITILLGACFIVLRAGFFIAASLPGNPRRQAVLLWKHSIRRLGLAGLKRHGHRERRAGEAEWAGELDKTYGLTAYTLYRNAAAARYAPEYTGEDFAMMKTQYRQFSARYRKTVSLPRRILAWVLPPLALLARPPGGLSKGVTALLCLGVLSLLFTQGDLRPQDQSDSTEGGADTLYEEAGRAQDSEFWERAIELYSQGSKRYPDDIRFPWALGSLYFSRRLYNLAWDEYRKADALYPDNPEVLYRLSRTAGYLNRDAVSAEYLERLLDIEPDNRDAIGSLGWMYYKLHRLAEGEELLLSALDRFGPDPDYAMTLGTVYSEMFRYDDAKFWYLEAIYGAEYLGDREFAAVAHYNLSLLESRYYNYAESFERTSASLDALDRPSGRLSRGELYLRRLDFSGAFNEYQTAYEIDTSPLSKLNLAQAYQIAGRLPEARLYAEDCLNSRDNSWMLNYGTNPDRYKRDIHEILQRTYDGLVRTEERTLYGSLKERIGGFFRGCYYRIKAASHGHLFRKYSLAAAAAYRNDRSSEGGQQLDALSQYYNAFEPYPRRAVQYLRNARTFEVPLIPKAENSYNAEEGALLKNPGLLRQSIADFDPVWERDMIADTYAEIALHARGKNRRAEKQDAAERLYALNRGALRQRGIPLPAELVIDTAASPRPKQIEAALRRALKKMGIRTITAGPETGSLDGEDDAVPGRFRLQITISAGGAGQTALCELYDRGRGIGVFSRSIPLASPAAADIAAFANTLGDRLFTVE